jgi:protein-L-isoaspartate(D-aspartate) O-methyltransferase
MSEFGEAVRIHQQQLLESMDEFFLRHGKSMSDSVRSAFLATPRHMFVDRYKTFPLSEWQHVDEHNLGQHLAVLYRDDGLGIFDDGNRIATISRPAMVLYMMEMLDLTHGLRVLEVGTGSGWAAALMGALVGPTGYVESVEIIPEVAARAKESIARAQVANVSVRFADGSKSSLAPNDGQIFDRVVFSTSAHDIPACIHRLMADGGLLLMVLKCPGGGDLLVLFRRQGNELLALERLPCEFISMSGQGWREEFEPVATNDLLKASRLEDKLLFRRPFSWGGTGTNDFAERTFPVRSFLAATEPNFTALIDADGNSAFAIQSDERDWLVIARNGEALCYGDSKGWDYFLHSLHVWVNLGMPTMLSMGLRAYPSGQAASPPIERYWMMKRRDTDFIWSV